MSIHKEGKINKICKQWEKGELEYRLPLWQSKQKSQENSRKKWSFPLADYILQFAA